MSFGISVRNGLAVGLLASTFLSSRSSRNIPASLILNFTDGIYRSSGRNYAFSDIITFSRTTNATLVDATGKLTYAPNNLVTNSEAFENAAWSKSEISVTANVATAPNGTSSADKLIATAVATSHAVAQSISVASGTTFTGSVYAKAGEYNFAAVLLLTTFAGAQIVICDLSTGTITSTSGSPLATSVTAVGNGWYRISITQITNATGTATMQVRPSNVGFSTTFTGDGTSGVFVWGAQLEQVTYQTAPSTYNSTSPANLLGFTEEFDNAAWTKQASVSVLPNTTIAPNGTLTGDTVTADSGFGVFQNVTVTIGTIVTQSVYLKAGTATDVMFRDDTGAGRRITVNTSTGAIISTGGVILSSSSTSAGNGWWRIAFSYVADTTVVRAIIRPDSAGAGQTLIVWGAQTSNSASLDPYIYNPAAAPTSIAYYGPRFDYNPVTLAPNGLLIEEQRVNSLLYSDQFDQATWTKAGATISPNITVSPDGTSNADKLVEDSTTGQHRFFRTATGTTNTNAYTVSFFAKAGERTRIYIGLAESPTFVRQGNAVFDLSAGTVVNASTGSGGASGGSATIQAFPNGWYRCTYTLTLGGTDTSIFNDVNLVSTGTTISYTGNGVSGAFVYGAQLEAGAFPTSYIPTVASTVTRAVDVALMTGTNFSSWYNASEGTLVTSALPIVSSVSKYSWSFNDGTGTELIAQYFLNVNAGGFVVDNGSAQAQIEAGTFSGVCKTAFAYKINDFALSLNGGTVTTDTVGTIPTTTQAQIGNRPDGSRTMNGYIRTLTYYPSRLTNAQLQALTA